MTRFTECRFAEK